MTIKRILNIPWQVTVIVTLAIYLAVGWNQPDQACQDSLFMGFCGLGKFLVLVFGAILMLSFGLIVFVLWKIAASSSENIDARQALNRRVLVVGIFFSAFPVIFQLIS
jgi:hypothetical protein